MFSFLLAVSIVGTQIIFSEKIPFDVSSLRLLYNLLCVTPFLGHRHNLQSTRSDRFSFFTKDNCLRYFQGFTQLNCVRRATKFCEILQKFFCKRYCREERQITMSYLILKFKKKISKVCIFNFVASEFIIPYKSIIKMFYYVFYLVYFY